MGGIGVNNNIVLINTFDRLKGTTKTAKEAILRTGAQRLRPVLLTSVTKILGLLPMVLGVNIDFITRETPSAHRPCNGGRNYPRRSCSGSALPPS